ncbi:hypothetical protein [Polymorphobacter sp.]|uniref:hypothetical protein n=1 Tax=Polymorphobacter sp. TaxID=1909290 RepID=UPI003F6F2A97
MFNKKILAVGALVIASMGLGACADQYAYGRAPGYDRGYAGYDQYWGDPYGWRNVPVGYSGSGFGWYDNYYYPGSGAYVYDRRGNRSAWNQRQRGYWQPRIVQRPPIVGRAIGGSIARQGLPPGQVRQQQRVVRQQGQVIRQQQRVVRQQNQVQRQERRVERQAQRPDFQRPQSQRPQSGWQGQRGGRPDGGQRGGRDRRN